MITNIFHLYENYEDYNETKVYGKLNEGIDWSIFAQFAEGKLTISHFL
jgi:hypothetical protein